eukprot:5967182-Alexandrium_andersonii.AAC.1
MGLPVGVRAPYPLLFDPSEFSDLGKFQLAGGAMHVHVMYAVLLFALSTTRTNQATCKRTWKVELDTIS